MPAAWQASRFSPSVWAVTAMMGVRDSSPGKARIWRVASIPSMRGIITSIRTSPIPPSRIASTAVQPSGTMRV